MDFALKGDSLTNVQVPEGFGGVYSVQAPNAAEMETAVQRLLTFLADPANGGAVVGNPATLASMVVGFSLGAAGDGASFTATISVQPYQTETVAGNWDPNDMIPVDSTSGQYAATGGWAALSFVDAQDMTDLRNRIAKHNQGFITAQLAAHGDPGIINTVHEVQMAGAGAGRIYMAGLLWSFDLRA